MRILLHCIHSKGGLTEHANYQARAFVRRGEELVALVPRDYLEGRPLEYAAARIYGPLHSVNKDQGFLARVCSLACRACSFLGTQWRLAWEVFRRKPDFVLLDSYIEYLSPLWIWPHWALAKFRGVRYVANLHDPVRDFRVGPAWWHDWSVKLAYAPIKIGVIHQHLVSKDVAPGHVTLIEAPVGVYDLQDTCLDPKAIRESWGAGRDDVVFLSFGFIRDGKNLDLLIRSLASIKGAFLVVMGSAQSSRNKPLEFYRDLAIQLGVVDRVVFREDFVPDEQVAGYFKAADVIAITYSSIFHSQSGVLNIAARARRPVLASSGESPLQTAVQKFRLGEFVEPDSLEAVKNGMDKLCNALKSPTSRLAPDWDGYEKYASWETNAEFIVESVNRSRGLMQRSRGFEPRLQPTRILYHCSAAEGGLAEYSKQQASSLSAVPGVEVLWQAPSLVFPPDSVTLLSPLPTKKREPGRTLLRRAFDFAADSLSSHWALDSAIRAHNPDAVLLSTWSEYFSPIWAPKLNKWRQKGIRFGAVIHDPVRDFVRGPHWWHRLSVRKAYSFLDLAFTHDSEPIDTYGGNVGLPVVQVPHGPYPVPVGESSKAEIRRELGIPEHAQVLLSFGHIRDGKNLDAIIKSLARLPYAHLLIAGREQSAGQKPVAFYQGLARQLGVAERCHWFTEYISNDDVWKFFRASDVLMLAYSKSFRSASGVLNVNAQFGLPVVVSAGRGPLLDAVQSYSLGAIVQEPDATSIAEAVPQALRVKGEWKRFADENSWRTNAEKVAEAFRSL